MPTASALPTPVAISFTQSVDSYIDINILGGHEVMTVTAAAVNDDALKLIVPWLAMLLTDNLPSTWDIWDEGYAFGLQVYRRQDGTANLTLVNAPAPYEQRASFPDGAGESVGLDVPVEPALLARQVYAAWREFLTNTFDLAMWNGNDPRQLDFGPVEALLGTQPIP